MKKLAFLIVILAIVIPAVGCSSEPTFEQQREATVEYLRAYNEIDNDLDDVMDSIMSTYTPALVPDYFQLNRVVTQSLSAYQGGLNRIHELEAPTDETLAHIEVYKKWLQDMISALQNLQSAISSGNQDDVNEAFEDLDNVGSQASQINRHTESLMVKYNIPDNEVNYKFRGI